MPTDQEPKNISRRSFVKRTAMGGAGLLVAADILSSDLAAGTPKSAMRHDGRPIRPREQVRLGIIRSADAVPTCSRFAAIERSRSRRSAIWCRKVARARQSPSRPADSAGFSKGEQISNLTRLDLDIVYIATRWNWHVPMALNAANGKHAAVEVPAYDVAGVLGHRRHLGRLASVRDSRELLHGSNER